MKKYIIQTITICLLIYAFFNISCQKLDPVPITKFSTLAEVSNISYNSATVKAKFMDVGEGVVSYGHCWGKISNPTIGDSKTTKLGLPAKHVEFTSQMDGLTANTKYYVRAYMTNAKETKYGNEANFTTSVGLPILTSNPALNVTLTTATSGGVISNDGGATITEKGVCWSTTNNPTISNNHTSDGTGVGSFTSTISGLTENTSYYLRAYATNSKGTAYGENIEFRTVGEFFIVGSFSNWNNHGQYMEKKGNGIFVAYQYLVSSSKFKFLPVRDSWAVAWGAQGANCGTTGTAVPEGTDICANNQAGFSIDGFYEIKLDANAKTVALTLISTIGIIGDAQSGGWTTDINLSFNTISKKWQGHIPFLATGQYVFRANDAWDISFRGLLTMLSTNSSASQIVTPGAGNYYVVLDLSGPDNFNATLTAPVIDVDGNPYNTLLIGTQVWMRENLKTTKYRNGVLIGTTSPANKDISAETNPKYQWAYDGNESNVTKYSRLYTWYAATDPNICPTGWHLPTDAEWLTLENFLIANGYNFDGTTTDNKIGKCFASISEWTVSSTVGFVGNNQATNNSSGFATIPCGHRNPDGGFYNLNGFGIYWTATESEVLRAWNRGLSFDRNSTYRSTEEKRLGISIRCIKN